MLITKKLKKKWPEFTKRLNQICKAKNEIEILELIPDPLRLNELRMDLEKQKKENDLLVSELNKRQTRINELTKTIEELQKGAGKNFEHPNVLKRKADENDDNERNPKKRRFEKKI